MTRNLGITYHLHYRWPAEQHQAETTGLTRQSMRAEQEELARLRRENATLQQEWDFYNVRRRSSRRRRDEIPSDPGVRPRYPIRLMCRALAASPTGYFAWRARPEDPGQWPIETCLPRFASFTTTIVRPMAVPASGGLSAKRAIGT